MYSSPTYKQKKYARILWCLIVFIFVSCIMILIFFSHEKSTNYSASIYQKGQLLKSISLSQVTEPFQLRIELDNGSYNVIEVRHNSIGIIESNCPNHLCIKQGFHSSSGIPITCLPHGLMIILTEENTQNITQDMIVY